MDEQPDMKVSEMVNRLIEENEMIEMAAKLLVEISKDEQRRGISKVALNMKNEGMATEDIERLTGLSSLEIERL